MGPVAAARSISTNYEFIKTDVVGTDGRVGLVTLNRPKALNALCAGLMDELIRALNIMDSDAKIGAMVVTGSEKVCNSRNCHQNSTACDKASSCSNNPYR